MNSRRLDVFVLPLALLALFSAGSNSAHAQAKTEHAASAQVELITAEELKTRFDNKELVTVLDVRATSSFADSDNKIKGAIHVKLRKLKYRLSFPPLKNVPRDSEIVTYCACPGDETSARAARILVESGFKRVRVLKGGWHSWLKAKGAVEPRPREGYKG